MDTTYKSICRVCDKEFKQLQGRRRKRCNNCNTKIRRLYTKLAAIKYLGGKCVRCGYDKHPAALEFHHTGREKNFTIGNVANRAWEVVKAELDLCELVCSNCHNIEHSDRFSNEKILAEAKIYQGKQKVMS